MPELDRQHRGQERAGHPGQLEQHLVAHEDPPQRPLRRVALHQALEREPSELGGGAGDEREHGEHGQRVPLERDARAEAGAQDARDHHRLLADRAREPRRHHVGQEPAGDRRAGQHREPPRGLPASPQAERHQEEQEPARRAHPHRADRGQRERGDPATRAHRPAGSRSPWAGAAAGSAPPTPRMRRRPDTWARRPEELQEREPERRRPDRTAHGDPAQAGVRLHQPLVGIGVGHREAVLRDRVHLRRDEQGERQREQRAASRPAARRSRRPRPGPARRRARSSGGARPGPAGSPAAARRARAATS